MYIAFLLVYFIVSCKYSLVDVDKTPAMGPWEFLLFVWVVAFLVDEVEQFCVSRANNKAHFQQANNMVDALNIVGLLLALVLRVLSLFSCTIVFPPGQNSSMFGIAELRNGRQLHGGLSFATPEDFDVDGCVPFRLARFFLGMLAIPVSMRLLGYMRIFYRLASLSAALNNVLLEVGIFLLFFLCVTFGFSLAFLSIMPPGDTDAVYTDVTTVLGVPAWALYGEFESAYHLIQAHHNHTGYVLLWLYSFISSVVLVNLLIAMSAPPRFEHRPFCAWKGANSSQSDWKGTEPTWRPTPCVPS